MIKKTVGENRTRLGAAPKSDDPGTAVPGIEDRGKKHRVKVTRIVSVRGALTRANAQMLGVLHRFEGKSKYPRRPALTLMRNAPFG